MSEYDELRKEFEELKKEVRSTKIPKVTAVQQRDELSTQVGKLFLELGLIKPDTVVQGIDLLDMFPKAHDVITKLKTERNGAIEFSQKIQHIMQIDKQVQISNQICLETIKKYIIAGKALMDAMKEFFDEKSYKEFEKHFGKHIQPAEEALEVINLKMNVETLKKNNVVGDPKNVKDYLKIRKEGSNSK